MTLSGGRGGSSLPAPLIPPEIPRLAPTQCSRERINRPDALRHNVVAIAKLLPSQGIAFGFLERRVRHRGFDYISGKTENFRAVFFLPVPPYCHMLVSFGTGVPPAELEVSRHLIRLRRRNLRDPNPGMHLPRQDAGYTNELAAASAIRIPGRSIREVIQRCGFAEPLGEPLLQIHRLRLLYEFLRGIFDFVPDIGQGP